MLQLIDTGETFTTRKEAKIKLGHSLFNKLLRLKKIQYINEKPFANYGKLHTITNEFNRH